MKKMFLLSLVALLSLAAANAFADGPGPLVMTAGNNTTRELGLLAQQVIRLNHDDSKVAIKFYGEKANAEAWKNGGYRSAEVEVEHGVSSFILRTLVDAVDQLEKKGFIVFKVRVVLQTTPRQWPNPNYNSAFRETPPLMEVKPDRKNNPNDDYHKITRPLNEVK